MSSQQKEVSLGLDIGTSNCCVAIARGVGSNLQIEVVPSRTGTHLTPSVVGFDADGKVMVGEMAKMKQLDNCARTFYDFKRVLGRKYNDPAIWHLAPSWTFCLSQSKDPGRKIDGVPVYAVLSPRSGSSAEYTALDLYTILVQHLIELAVSRLAVGEQIVSVTATVPVHFNAVQREHTRTAVQQAFGGKKRPIDIVILDEPVAAVTAYTQQGRLSIEEIPPEKRVMVFDLGGGTLDVTILKRDGRQLVVCASEGKSNLGGTDFDKALVDHVAERYNRITKRNLQADKKKMARVRQQCEAAKLLLSETTTEDIDVNDETVVTVTRDKFDNLIASYLRQATELIWKAVTEANVESGDVSHVIVVGGSSQVPAVQSMLRHFFDGNTTIDIRNDINPTESVAQGAAVHAFHTRPTSITEASTTKETGNQTGIRAALSVPIGIRLASGEMHVLFPKNTVLPCAVTKPVWPKRRTQKTATVRIHQGVSTRADDNTALGAACIELIRNASLENSVLRLTLTVDTGGILTCLLQDMNNRAVNERMTFTK